MQLHRTPARVVYNLRRRSQRKGSHQGQKPISNFTRSQSGLCVQVLYSEISPSSKLHRSAIHLAGRGQHQIPRGRRTLELKAQEQERYTSQTKLCFISSSSTHILSLKHCAHCSSSEKVRRLLSEQQRIQEELAELQEEAGELNAEELLELKTLLGAADPSTSPANEQSSQQKQRQQQREGKRSGKKGGSSALPPDVAKFFMGPGVLDKMDSKATPREPSLEARETNSDRLRVWPFHNDLALLSP